MALAVHNLGTAGYAIGFITFVFLSVCSLSMAWILKYTHEFPSVSLIHPEVASEKEMPVAGHR